MSTSANADTFVVIFPNYYGKGRTIAEAVKAARKAGWDSRGKSTARVYAFSCRPEDLIVRADVWVSFQYPDGTLVLQWEEKL